MYKIKPVFWMLAITMVLVAYLAYQNWKAKKSA